MRIDVFDLSGKLVRENFDVSAGIDVWTSKPKSRSRVAVGEVLVFPKGGNRLPYLQDPRKPQLCDFLHNGSGDISFSYENASIVDTIFAENANGISSRERFDKLQKYIAALNFSEESEANIIAVSDEFSSEMQEQILIGSGGFRSRTRLLWRSVAAVLGAEKYLLESGAKEGSKVAVVDVQRTRTNVSVLTLTDNGGAHLVPQRKSYRNQNAHLQGFEKFVEYQYGADDGVLNAFYEHTFRGNRDEVAIWNESEKKFETKRFSLHSKFASVNRTVRVPESSDFCILLGENVSADWVSLRGKTKLITERDDENFVCEGCAKYAARKKSGDGSPVYFDEYEGLYIAVSVADEKGERIELRELVPPNPKCAGGEKIDGIENDDCYIREKWGKVDFYLCEGLPKSNDNDALKLLGQNFEKTEKKINLKLVSFVNPGQGLAVVNANADAFSRPVKMDLMKMTPAGKSLDDLNNEMNRSYPVDMPGVKASSMLWWKPDNRIAGGSVCAYVNSYMSGTKPADGNLFRKTMYPNLQSAGLKRFERIDVFGSVEGGVLPSDTGGFNFDALFSRLAADFKRKPTNDILGMISWTYQRKNPQFREVKDVARNFILNGACSGLNVVRLFTVCKNLFSEKKDLKDFLGKFLEEVFSHSTKCLWHWCRAMFGILVNNPGMLKYAGTDKDIKACIEKLSQLYKPSQGSNTRLEVLKCMLFLLGRRRYSRNFLRGAKEISEIKRCLREVEKTTPSEDAWREVLCKYLDGVGTIDGIPNFNMGDN